jgi:hypothetical protein
MMKPLSAKLSPWIFPLIILFFTILMIEISLPYTAMDKKAPIEFLRTKLNVWHHDIWRWGFFLHVFTSPLVLLAGALQFNSHLINNRPLIHRYLGLSYLIIVLFISGPGAFVMGIYANGGAPAKVSFVFLTTLWLIFTALAWYYAKRKRYIVHAEFMIRGYALTLSAITLRIYGIVINHYHFGLKPVDKYIIVAWLSWVPNIIIAEMIIRSGLPAKLLKKKKSEKAIEQ